MYCLLNYSRSFVKNFLILACMFSVNPLNLLITHMVILFSFLFLWLYTCSCLFYYNLSLCCFSCQVFTCCAFLHKFRECLRGQGYSVFSSDLAGHSFCRGGPIEFIKILGDWKSDSVLIYFTVCITTLETYLHTHDGYFT